MSDNQSLTEHLRQSIAADEAAKRAEGRAAATRWITRQYATWPELEALEEWDGQFQLTDHSLLSFTEADQEDIGGVVCINVDMAEEYWQGFVEAAIEIREQQRPAVQAP